MANYFLFGAIGAPLSEEILFRGYAFNALRGSMRSERGGLIMAYGLSTLLFTLPHALGVTQGTIGLLIPLFLIGLALAYLLVNYFLEILGSLWTDAAWTQEYSLLHHFDPGAVLTGDPDPIDLVIVYVAALIPIVYALLIFPKRDLAAPA